MQGHISTIALLCAIFVSASARTFTDGLFAQNLLGSHFGVPGVSASYDYVVIGGGTAGLTVATRLASNSSVSVAVIEAGDFYQFSNGNYSEIPAYASEFTGNDPTNINPYLDWYMYTTHQPVRSLVLKNFEIGCFDVDLSVCSNSMARSVYTIPAK